MKAVLRNFAEDVAAGKFVRLGTKNERIYEFRLE